jgi:cyclopropane fatty-acyl-phospholipid synthase-like methyltransferase
MQKDIDIQKSVAERAQVFAGRKKDFFDFCLNNLNFSRLSNIQQTHLEKNTKQTKYNDLGYWFDNKWETVMKVLDGADMSEGMNILDIGCGPGHMAYIYKYLGFKVQGLDIPDQGLYNDLTNSFGVERTDHVINPFESLPNFPKRFDLATAISCCFFRMGKKKAEHQLFSLKEWDFFLNNLANDILTESGKLYMTLNPVEHAKGLHYNDQSFIDYVESRGGEISGTTVYFPTMRYWHN